MKKNKKICSEDLDYCKKFLNDHKIIYDYNIKIIEYNDKIMNLMEEFIFPQLTKVFNLFPEVFEDYDGNEIPYNECEYSFKSGKYVMPNMYFFQDYLYVNIDSENDKYRYFYEGTCLYSSIEWNGNYFKMVDESLEKFDKTIGNIPRIPSEFSYGENKIIDDYSKEYYTHFESPEIFEHYLNKQYDALEKLFKVDKIQKELFLGLTRMICEEYSKLGGE